MKGKSYLFVDLRLWDDYHLDMDTYNSYNQDVNELENCIHEAIDIISQYKNENIALKQKMDSLIQEKSILMQKNDQAKSRLESMITRLKSLEQQSS